MSLLLSLPTSSVASLPQPGLSLKDLAVSVDYPCSKAFPGSPLPAAEQGNSSICLCETGPSGGGPKLSLTLRKAFAPPAEPSSPLATNWLEKQLLLPVQAQKRASWLEALAGAPTKVIELLE